MDELKASIEKLARERNVSEIDIVTELQSAAAMTGMLDLLEELCEVKHYYIEAVLFPVDVP